MIKVFYGEDIVSSRKALIDEVEKARRNKTEVSFFDGKKISLNELVLAIESKCLFGADRFVVIENLFSNTKSKEFEKIISLLKKNIDAQVVLWQDKDLSLALTKSLNNFKLQQFKISSFLFKFLDSLKPGQAKTNIENFHLCLSNEDPEMIFAMLIRQIRLLILAKEGEKFLSKLAPWQKNKILSQAKLFNKEKLLQIYQKLLEIDFQQKTSQTPFSYRSALDLLLVEI